MKNINLLKKISLICILLTTHIIGFCIEIDSSSHPLEVSNMESSESRIIINLFNNENYNPFMLKKILNSPENPIVIALDQRCASKCEAAAYACMSSAKSNSEQNNCKSSFKSCVFGCP